MEVIVPPDAVKVAISWLSARLPDTLVTKNRPNPLSGNVVTIRRSGGVKRTMVTDSPWLSVEVFAPTDEACADLAMLTWGQLFAMEREVIDGVQCYLVQALSHPSDMPLAGPGDMQRPRYVMSVQADLRATAVA